MLSFRSDERHTLTECDEGTLHKSKTLDRALRSNALFVLLLVLVLSIAVLVLVLVLVLEAIEYTHQAHWSASYPEPPRSTIGIAAVQTAVEYEYDEIRCEARAPKWGGWHTFTIETHAHWKCAICNSLDFD